VTCDRFPDDVYAFHVLGLSEEPERGQLLAHLRQECETCVQGLKQALAFWYLFGASSEAFRAGPWRVPSPALRGRVLSSIRPTVRRMFVPAWTWTRAAAGIAVVTLTAVTAWQIGQVALRPVLRSVQTALSERSATAQRLEAENQTLRNTIAAGAQPAAAPVAPPVAAPPATPSAPAANATAALQQQIQDAQNATAAAAQALAAERAQTAQLQRDLADQMNQLAAAARSLADAEQRYQAALANANREKARGDQRDAELAASQARIRDLEGQVTQIRRAAEVQQQNLDQYVRMTTMLQSPNVTLVRLRATEAGQRASAVALFTVRSGLLFYAAPGPAPPPGRTYQLWLIRDRGPAIVSAGTFASAAQNAPTLQFANAAMISGIKGVAVTDEPVGGSPLPTGHKLLIGTPRG